MESYQQLIWEPCSNESNTSHTIYRCSYSGYNSSIYFNEDWISAINGKYKSTLDNAAYNKWIYSWWLEISVTSDSNNVDFDIWIFPIYKKTGSDKL